MIRVIHVMRNITDRKINEEMLRLSEEKYRGIFNNAMEAMFQTTEDGKFISVNPAAAKMLGYSSPEEVIDRATNIAKQVYVNPDDRKKVLNQAMNLVGLRNHIVEFKRIDGKHIWVSMSLRAVRKVDGSLAYFDGMAQDITESKLSRDKLMESEEKYSTVINNANESIIVAQDGMLKFVNPKVSEVLEYTSEEMVSRPFIEFIFPEDRKMVGGNYLKRLRGEEVPSSYDFRIVCKSGKIKWFQINAVLIQWEGRPASLNFLAEITERKNAEQALKEKNEREAKLFEKYA
jgi:PAS domain S-box-containing protein